MEARQARDAEGEAERGGRRHGGRRRGAPSIGIPSNTLCTPKLQPGPESQARRSREEAAPLARDEGGRSFDVEEVAGDGPCMHVRVGRYRGGAEPASSSGASRSRAGVVGSSFL